MDYPVKFSTCMDLPLSAGTKAFRVGKLSIVTQHFKDRGLVGSTVQIEHQVHNELADELEKLGLPSAFGSQTGHKKQSKKHKSHGDSQGCSNVSPQQDHGVWYQAWDDGWGAYYYYNEQLQITQWEPPKETFIPWTAATNDEQQQAAQDGSEVEGHSAQLQKPRMETTGLMPSIPEPQGSHIHFDSSSDELDESHSNKDPNTNSSNHHNTNSNNHHKNSNHNHNCFDNSNNDNNSGNNHSEQQQQPLSRTSQADAYSKPVQGTTPHASSITVHEQATSKGVDNPRQHVVVASSSKLVQAHKNTDVVAVTTMQTSVHQTSWAHTDGHFKEGRKDGWLVLTAVGKHKSRCSNNCQVSSTSTVIRSKMQQAQNGVDATASSPDKISYKINGAASSSSPHSKHSSASTTSSSSTSPSNQHWSRMSTPVFPRSPAAVYDAETSARKVVVKSKLLNDPTSSPHPAAASEHAAAASEHKDVNVISASLSNHMAGTDECMLSSPESASRLHVMKESCGVKRDSIDGKSGVNQGRSKVWPSQESRGACAAADGFVLDAETSALVRQLLPRKNSKYYWQRYSLFSKFDEGILLDNEGWFSATPEVIARHQAERCRKGSVVLDAFAGCGGNTVQFAMAGLQVIATELCATRLQLAKHNAAIYGVSDKVDFICADFFRVGPDMAADVIFLSPPWGGPDYKYSEVYDLSCRLPGLSMSFLELIQYCLGLVRKCEGQGVMCFLPRNTSLEQLSDVVPEGEVWTVEKCMLNDRCKGVTVYCGAF